MSTINRLLTITGRVVPTENCGVELLLGQLSRSDVKRFVELVLFHRVEPQVRLNLERLALSSVAASENAHVILNQLTPHVDELFVKTRRHKQALRELIAVVDEVHGVPIAGLKGIHLERLYDANRGQRVLADVDVLVQTEDLWTLLSVLIRQGYAIDKLRFGKYKMYRSNPGYPSAYGICETMKLDGSPIYIDVHIGAFPACGEGLISIGRNDLVYDEGLWFPRIEKTIIISLAHIIRQGFCRFRDINDFYLLLQQPNIDFNALHTSIHSANLGAVYHAMLRLVARYYPRYSLPVAKTSRHPYLVFADKFLLLEHKKKAGEYTDGVKFTRSRVWQIQYLAKLYIENYGLAAGIIEVMRNSTYLLQTGRPYKVWTTRKVGGISDAERFVLCPVASYTQEINVDALKKYVDDHASEADFIPSFGFAVLNSGMGNELVVAPGLILTQCSYVGSRADIPDLSCDVRALAKALKIPNYQAL